MAKDKKRGAVVNEQKAKERGRCWRLFFLYSFLSFFLIFIISGCATTDNIKESAIPEDKVITAIDLQDYSVTVKVNKPFSYTLYKSDDPYKIIVNLLDVNSGVFNKKIVSDKVGITQIIPSQINNPFMTRLEILLQTPTTAEPEYKDNELKIKIKGESPEKKVTEREVITKATRTGEEMPAIREPEPAEPERKALQKATEIISISYEKTPGVTKVLVKGNGSMNPNVMPLANRLVVDVPGVDMKAQIPSEVISPLKGIRSGKNGGGVRLVFDLKEKTDFDVTTSEDTIVVALSSPIIHNFEEKTATEEFTPPKEGKYTGKRISLDFQDTDIVPIFRLLADISGYNLVVSPEVHGKLTMKLLNVPWDQALDIILKTFSLGKTVENNIIRIATHKAFAAESEEAARAKESELKVLPLETKIFAINYADVSSIGKAIKDAKILSSRGSISIDKRTSSVAVNDIASVFPEVENLLATLDKPTPQVMIEARIVEATSSDVRSLGIQWGISHSEGNKPYTGPTLLTRGPFTGNNFMVDLPSPEGTAGGIAFGILNTARTAGLELQLTAIETVGRSRTVSNPRLVTTDNEKATIIQGESVPFPKIDVQSGQISAEYKDVAITVEVVPHITPSGSVSMSILVRKEDLETLVNLAPGVQAPRTSKIEGNTKVLVQSGDTIVIGGLLKKIERESTAGVPGLMNIPLLGWLFKSKSTTEETIELLIFIRPQVLESRPQVLERT